jgi:NCAIR mutase (PurE)-related protein
MIADFEFDWDREKRTGLPEAVLCAHKSAAQIDAIVAEARKRQQALLLTRLGPEKFAALDVATRNALTFAERAGTAWTQYLRHPERIGIGIVAAGTSDLPVAEEAQTTLAFLGYQAPLIADVGVAGLWRLMAHLEEIRAFKLVIAVAGMEGALFSVLGGLVASPVVAVPTSVGYGITEGGRIALGAALGTCAPGMVAVNIDNGFGAAMAAAKIMALAPADPD